MAHYQGQPLEKMVDQAAAALSILLAEQATLLLQIQHKALMVALVDQLEVFFVVVAVVGHHKPVKPEIQ